MGNNLEKIRYSVAIDANVATLMEISTQLGEYLPHAACNCGKPSVGIIIR
jgi:hypothetical protein